MLELEQIQSNVLREYRRGEGPAFVRYVFLRFGDEARARAFIGALMPHVRSCADVDRGVPWVLNLGLTYAAIEMFGHGGDARSLDDRDHEVAGAIEAFKQGMRPRARAVLGDDGPSAVKHWDAAFRDDQLHAVLSLSAHERAGMDAVEAVVDEALAAETTVVRLHDEQGEDFGGEHAGTEHFGYADGISQPSILYSGLPEYPGEGKAMGRRGWGRLQPGEVVLGYVDESGKVQFRSRFFKNGSFMVFRKLEQHVERFRRYVAELAARNEQDPELIAAKIVGRWRSGAPLVLRPKRDDPELGSDPQQNNDFRYASDPEGLACPFGAHVRRAHPREDPTGPTEVQTRLHRILRRGTPYGPRLAEGAPDDGKERGLLFVVINADISRQFEFVQLNWINSVLSSTRLTLPADRDPLVGSQRSGDGAGKLVMPSSRRRRAPTIAWSLPRFVTTRGGAYFLLPSLDTLHDLANETPVDRAESPERVPEAPAPSPAEPSVSPSAVIEPPSTPSTPGDEPEPSSAPERASEPSEPVDDGPASPPGDVE